MRTITPPNARQIPPEAEKVFSGQIFDVYQWQQTLFDGSTTTFEMLRRPDTVQVVCIKDNQIVIIKQLQPTMPAPTFCIPAGRHDNPSETELEAAQREVLEETGMTFSSWKLLDAYQPTSKLDWIVYTFLAYDLTYEQPQSLDPGEQIEVTLMPLEEIKSLATRTGLRDIPIHLFDSATSTEDLKSLPTYNP